LSLPAVTRHRLRVEGVVQGVGFRPFFYRAAVGLGLAGWVGNDQMGVVAEVEGSPAAVEELARVVREEAPPLARVTGVTAEVIPPRGTAGFTIAPSVASGAAATLVPPDVATCGPCLLELRDPADRRHGYAFTNCTDCGPRYTIIHGVPYDRARTTMRGFTLCAACQAEYEDPASRRFHAEPNACPACGPRLWMTDRSGRTTTTTGVLAEAAHRLARGQVLAVKGVGGFHLAVDAHNQEAVERLRLRKQRESKPLAVMAPGVEVVRSLAHLRGDEEALLLSPPRPIVLLEKREPFPLAPSVAPGNSTIGVMLPYAPLHHLLLDACAPATPVLVMTSANPHDEPLARDNDEARARLGDIADAFLLHDRPILTRVDDSVAFHQDRPRLVRRSRGYTPLPVTLAAAGPPVLGVGGDLKNAFCVTRGRQAFLGPHVGDLENAATAASFLEAAAHLCRLLEVRPAVVAHDLHPDYVSSCLARTLATEVFPGATLLPVQHHHAHVLSCLAEHGHVGTAWGVALDGVGFGTDGTSWGGEVLRVDGAGFQRVARLGTLPLPGGDRAAREPWRIVAALGPALGWPHLGEDMTPGWEGVDVDVVRTLAHLAGQGAPFPRSSSLGRLFDVVSALLGVRCRSRFEGEAAMALEQVSVGVEEARPFPVACDVVDGIPAWQTLPLLRAVVEESRKGVPAAELSARFHATVVEAVAELLVRAAGREGPRVVALSGGAMQNRVLLRLLPRRLEGDGFHVLTHADVPANDGGLALGQAAAARASCGAHVHGGA
jgi:hydrogenase maturation protein HypF